jgi:methyltransferase (TIGR00027 family)
MAATVRAAHQLLDAEPRILTDPVVVGLVDDATRERIEARREELTTPAMKRQRSLVVVRARFAEDELAAATTRGVLQYVILGAGLDTFAYRCPPFAEGVRIFEVDQPATQAWKRQLFTAAGTAPPPNLTWAPIDFEQRSLIEGLAAAGFDTTQPAFFSWLGVTQYLTLPAIEATLGSIASLPHKSGVAMTIVVPDDEVTGLDLELLQFSAQLASSVGEPWRTRLRAPDVCAWLSSLGFSDVFHLTPEESAARYFGDRSDGLQVCRGEQLIRATV